MKRTLLLALSLLISAGAVHAQGTEGRLKKIASTKTITIAHRTDATPFAYVDEKKQLSGFTIDLCKRVVNSIERQLNVPKLEIKWLPVTTATRFEVIAKGQADMECGSSTVTLARLKQVDFSSYIFTASTGLLTKASAGARSISDLSGKRIAVIAGTTNEQAVNAQLKSRKLNATVVPFKSREEAMGAFEAGKVDAFASDKMLLVGAGMSAKDPKAFALLPDELSFEPYAIALPRNDSDFRLAVNTGLAQLYSSGEIVEIFGRWFGQFGDPGAVTKVMYLLGSIPE